MTRRSVARVGDATDHEGFIIEGSEDVYANGIGVARALDATFCPIHGINPIVSASTDVFANRRGVARVGDATACGAKIITGSLDTFVN
jgi:uncharacterized Zn-binding protein involved in type VI secretion